MGRRSVALHTPRFLQLLERHTVGVIFPRPFTYQTLGEDFYVGLIREQGETQMLIVEKV
jgi:hypothetical protein